MKQANFSTLAILPVYSDVPLDMFPLELHNAMPNLTQRLTSGSVKAALGAKALGKNNELRLRAWLISQIESRHETLLCQCAFEFTPRTQRCLREADRIL